MAAAIAVDIAPFTPQVFDMAPGESLVVTQRGDTTEARRIARNGTMGPVITLPKDAPREDLQGQLDAILRDTTFARPGKAEAHPAMQQTRSP
jgi:hypothetical protein